MSELRYDGRVAVVTGAGRGVGRGHALLLAERGAKVVVADLGGALEGGGRDAGPAEQVAKEIEAAGGDAVAVCGSVADEKEAAAMIQSALDTWGRIDVLVNNAGIADPDLFAEMSVERFRTMIDVHYLGTVNTCLAAWPHMVEAGYGRIVNTTSEAATGNVPKATAYGAAKGAVHSFTRELALEAPRYNNIRVNAVAPRANTRLAAPEVVAKTYDMTVEEFDTSSMQIFRPELVAPAMAFLAHESCTLQGEVLISGGGQVMSFGFVQNEGVTFDENLTPEDVAANLDAILDLSKGAKVAAVSPM